MEKIIVPVMNCKTGDILAQEVVNCSGVKLISKNTVINEFIKEKLMDLEIFDVWVYDSIADCSLKSGGVTYEDIKSNYSTSMGTIKKMLIDLSSDKELNYSTVEEVSNIIFSGINESDYIVKCLSEVKKADEYTYAHCVNTAFYAMLTGKWLKLDDADIKGVIQAGLVHDIGKVKIPKKILNKKGRLDYREFEEMKKHTLYGYDIVSNIKALSSNVKEAVLMHHERVNGSGYPYGISGESISLYAKIIAIADVYDAMTSERVYKKRVTPFDVFGMFVTDGMTAFDVDILRNFLSNMSTYYIGAEVLLNTGDKGKIAFVPPYDVANPIVFSQSNYIDLSRESEVKVLSLL